MMDHRLIKAARKLAAIADAYDANGLDDEARKFWGLQLEHKRKYDPERTELYNGRGGKSLLTLQDCMDARLGLLAEGLRDYPGWVPTCRSGVKEDRSVTLCDRTGEESDPSYTDPKVTLDVKTQLKMLLVLDEHMGSTMARLTYSLLRPSAAVEMANHLLEGIK